MNRRALIVRAVAMTGLAASSVATAQTPTEPRAIVEQMYKISAGKDGKYAGESAFFQKPLRDRWFSKALRKGLAEVDAMSKRTGDVGLDFDPVTNSQDPLVKGLKVSPESASAGKSIVAAKFNSGGKNMHNIRYIFVREGDAWKLDDLTGEIGGKDRWVMSEIIKELLKP